MIMTMKCAAAMLTSLGLLAMVASLHAQQDTRKVASPNADLAPVERQKQAYYDPSGADAKESRKSALPTGETFLKGAADVFKKVAPNSSFYGTTEWKRIAESPELSRLSAQESNLAKQADALKQRLDGATTDSQRSETRTKLAEVLGNQFDLRQVRHGLEIEALETQVRKLRELVRRRQERREEIISRRVEQIVREAEGLGW